MQVSDLLGMVANLHVYPRPSQPCLGGCLALSRTSLPPHLPVVPLVVSLWLFIRHCRPGSGFLEGKSPSLGPRMTAVGELTLTGLTPRDRGLGFSAFCGVWGLFCLFWVFWFFIFVEWFFVEWFWVFKLRVLQKSLFLKGETESYEKKVGEGP